MDVAVYVAKDEDREAVERVFAELRRSHGEDNGLNLECTNLYGSELSGIPGIVLQVMRIKRANTMPLTVINGHPVISGTLPTSLKLETFVREGVSGAAAFVLSADSAVQFKTDKRVHISMLVRSLENTVRFYEVFLGQSPTKYRADYAKFEVEEPPLVISFIPDSTREPIPGGAASHLGVNHLGVQVKSSDVVMRMKERFVNAGFLAEEEVETPCCYAVQTKTWVGDPDGNRWEVYVVTEDEAAEGCGADCVCYSEIAPSQVTEDAERVTASA